MKYFKGQLELWMLTKMAMLFFIIGLSFIILNVSNIEKGALCKEQAMSTARLITSNINQVTTDSTEDEVLVYKFQPTLSAGSEKTDRYLVNLSVKELGEGAGSRFQVSVKVSAINERECQATSTVFLDRNRIEPPINFQSTPYSPPREINGEDGRTLTLLPSNSKVSERSRFLVISKCTSKIAFGSMPHLTFIDCGGDVLDPTTCGGEASFNVCAAG